MKFKSVDSRKLFIFNLCIITTKIALGIIYDYPAFHWTYGEPLSLLAEEINSVYADLNGYGIGGYGLFMFILKGIDYLERDAMIDLMSSIGLRSNETSPLKVYCKVQKFLAIKRNFCQSLSFIPCIWFAFAFVKLSVDIVKLQIESTINSKVSVGFFVILVTQVVTMAFVASSACNRSRSFLISLEKSVIFHPHVHEWTETLNKIDEAKNFKYRAYDSFPLTRKVLLTFLSSLVTYTVLFLQIVNVTKSNDR
jgi:hypothetical protein